MRRVAALLLLAGCGSMPPVEPQAPPKVPNNVGHFFGAPYVELPVSLWAETTYSPQAPAPLTDARESELLEACGKSDHALSRVAKEAPPEVEPVLRAVGSPAVRPRVITAKATANDGALRQKLREMRTANTRCGVGTKDGVTTIISVEHLADLAPLTIRSRTGAWLELDATVNVPASAAKVVVLGPRGAPKTYPTTIDAQGRAHARFVLDRPGGFTVQLIADVEGGPRPLLEARTFADVPPSHVIESAPGEGEPSLDAMIAAVRTEEGLPALVRDARLDALAADHADRMKEMGKVAHDLGRGDFAQRFQEAGYSASVVGENVAKAERLGLAHRALYASPSHRLNLMHAGYTRFGIATVTDGPRIWVCEVFSSELR